MAKKKASSGASPVYPPKNNGSQSALQKAANKAAAPLYLPPHFTRENGTGGANRGSKA